MLDDPRCPVTAEVGKQLARTIDALRAAGVKLEEGWPSGVDSSGQYDAYLHLMFAETSPVVSDRMLRRLRESVSARGDYGTAYAHALTDPYKRYAAALEHRAGQRSAWREYFRSHDVFLMPASFVTAFEHLRDQPNFFLRRLATSGGSREYNDLAFWASFATFSGLPATVAPVGVAADGLPVGVQIVGPDLEDATPIEFAGHLAGVIGGFTPPAGI